MRLKICLIFFALFSYRVRPYVVAKDNFLEQLVLLLLAAAMAIVNASVSDSADTWSRGEMVFIVTCSVGILTPLAGSSTVVDEKIQRRQKKKAHYDQPFLLLKGSTDLVSFASRGLIFSTL